MPKVLDVRGVSTRQLAGMRRPVTSSIEISTQCAVERVAQECSGPRRSSSNRLSSVIS